MRRASQRHSLVTLNEINITPLLDLAFVLLIIFIITRPVLEQSVKLDLPSGGTAEGRLNREDIARVEVTAQGQYFLDGRQMTLNELEQALVNKNRTNPRLVVDLAGDRIMEWANGVNLFDILQRNGITRFRVKTRKPGAP
jgi:biopolymer transport protein ExbD